jgi:hypothetical protein
MHFTSEDLVRVRLVLLPLPSKPCEHIGIHANAYELLDWPVEPPDLNLGRPRNPFRSIGRIDLRIGRAASRCNSPRCLSVTGVVKARSRELAFLAEMIRISSFTIWFLWPHFVDLYWCRLG